MARRILVLGGSGAGKTTLARALSERLGLPFVEMDALHHGPNWTAATASELRARLLRLLDDDVGWVVDGDYLRKLGTLLRDRATLIVWLDLPLATKLRQLTLRTARRWWRREVLWNGNRESLKDMFWGREALFPWAISSHFRHRRTEPGQLAGRPLARLRTSHAVAEWFAAYVRESNES